MMTPVTHGAGLKAEEGRIVKRAMTTCYVKVPSNSFEQENILMWVNLFFRIKRPSDNGNHTIIAGFSTDGRDKALEHETDKTLHYETLLYITQKTRVR